MIQGIRVYVKKVSICKRVLILKVNLFGNVLLSDSYIETLFSVLNLYYLNEIFISTF